jgi:hypothetical protein
MSINSNSSSQQFKPSVTGTKVERGINNLANVIKQTSSLSGGERTPAQDPVDIFKPKEGAQNIEDQKISDLQNTKELAKKNNLRNQELVNKANNTASGILMKIALGLDPSLLEFTQKGTEGKSPQEAEQITKQNIEQFINDKDNVTNLQILTAKLSEKISGDKKINPDGGEGISGKDESKELLAELEDVMASGSHEEVQQFLAKLQGSNPELLKSLDLKTQIKQYQKDLSAIFKSEQRNIANLRELENHPLYKNGLEFKGDKAQRNLFAKLAGQMVDARGGIYNYRDDQVTGALAPFEYKPDINGRSVADITIRRLLPGEIAGNSRTYTSHLTEEQPTYEYMNVA